MFNLSLDRLPPGAVLGKTILADDGVPLLRAGTELTARLVEGLRSRGIHAVYVRDGLADDLVPEDIVSDQVRTTIASHVRSTFAHVATIGREHGIAGGIDQIDADLGDQPLELGSDGDDLVAAMYVDVELLIAEILESNAVAGLETLKQHNEYTFQHSVDVAVVGVLLGKRLALPRGRLRELALGCLLHDIGKTFIDAAILDKPGKLTDEEFAVIQDHPRLGFELIRRMPVHSLLPAHVAYQHHERQQGGGYPRGLVGTNRVGARAREEKIGSGQLLLIAEIGAVADVYSALTADRPYREALLPDQVLDTLQGMAGAHLNREIVAELRRLVPPYPTGRWVEVVAGAHTGWRGVVADVPRAALDRPTVHLLITPAGDTVDDPVVVDLRSAPDARLVCVSNRDLPIQQHVAVTA